jgi:DNA gyrase subunit B
VCRQNKQYFVEFKDGGITVAPLKEIGTSEKAHGTVVEFYPDFSIMEQAPFDHNIIAARLQQLAYLNKSIRIIFIDQQMNTKDE